MPRILRIYLVGCIAITFAYLLLHTREPLRLNVGDPWADAAALSSIEYVEHHGFTPPLMSESYRPNHDRLAEVVFGGMGRLGVGSLMSLRLFALAFSMLSTWLMFLYVRRVWGETVALIATALLATSVLSMMFADSIDRPPIIHAACLLALWGLASAIDTQQPRHYAAAIAGSFLCMFGVVDDWVLLLAGVLFTVYIKRGNPFAPRNRRFVIVCAVGAFLALLMKSVFGSEVVEWNAGSVEWQAAIDHKLTTSLAALLRRYTLIFTPMFWITFGYTTWRALRAPSVTSVIEDGMTWLLAVALLVVYVSSRSTAPPMLRALPVLPFYAIGSAILIAGLLQGRRIPRALAIAWAVLAPAWGAYLMVSHPRSVLAREDVAKARSYFATNDRNDFVISNLLSDGPIHASFGRHTWPAPELDSTTDPHAVLVQTLKLFEATGTDYVHAVIFTTPESRFVDRSLGQLVPGDRFASVTGWPYLTRSKANRIIRDYDKTVFKGLEALGAKQVLHLGNFDVYRIDRATVLEVAGRSIPVVRAIDFSNAGATLHQLLGWSNLRLTEDGQIPVTGIEGHLSCTNPLQGRQPSGEPAANACETIATRSGLLVIDEAHTDRAQLMIRVERACDLRLTLEFAPSALLVQMERELASSTVELAPPASELATSMRLVVAMNEFAVSQCRAERRVSVVIPQRAVRTGVNIVTFRKQQLGSMDPWADIVSLAIEPSCEPAQ